MDETTAIRQRYARAWEDLHACLQHVLRIHTVEEDASDARLLTCLLETQVVTMEEIIQQAMTVGGMESPPEHILRTQFERLERWARRVGPFTEADISTPTEHQGNGTVDMNTLPRRLLGTWRILKRGNTDPEGEGVTQREKELSWAHK